LKAIVTHLMPMVIVKSRHRPRSMTAPTTKGSLTIAGSAARFPGRNPRRAADWPPRNKSLDPTSRTRCRLGGKARRDELLSSLSVATVVSENECGRETEKELTAILGEPAGFSIDALGDQYLSRGLARLSRTGRESFRRFGTG
jgi:hypothetical protein